MVVFEWRKHSRTYEIDVILGFLFNDVVERFLRPLLEYLSHTVILASNNQRLTKPLPFVHLSVVP
jgi:hypothetical protein